MLLIKSVMTLLITAAYTSFPSIFWKVIFIKRYRVKENSLSFLLNIQLFINKQKNIRFSNNCTAINIVNNNNKKKC